MNYIRQYYRVPAKRGGRIKYLGGTGGPRFGTIKSAKGPHLRILLDGDRWPGHFHPTWKLEYL